VKDLCTLYSLLFALSLLALQIGCSTDNDENKD